MLDRSIQALSNLQSIWNTAECSRDPRIGQKAIKIVQIFDGNPSRCQARRLEAFDQSGHIISFRSPAGSKSASPREPCDPRRLSFRPLDR